MEHANGFRPDDQGERLRWLWLGGSITSDRDNPLVPVFRLLIEALQDRGHEIEYLEPAVHPAFRERLANEGSAFYRAFLAEHPAIRYRRYDMPRAAERDVWLSREAALVDVLVVEEQAPPDVFAWLERVDETSLTRVLVGDAGAHPSLSFDLIAGGPETDIPIEVTDREAAPHVVDQLLNEVRSARARLTHRT